jgi:hypothetical protein
MKGIGTAKARTSASWAWACTTLMYRLALSVCAVSRVMLFSPGRWRIKIPPSAGSTIPFLSRVSRSMLLVLLTMRYIDEHVDLSIGVQTNSFVVFSNALPHRVRLMENQEECTGTRTFINFFVVDPSYKLPTSVSQLTFQGARL